MFEFVFCIIGIFVIIHFIKEKNKKIMDKVFNDWLTTTAKITRFEKRIQTDSEGDKTTIYIAYGEYYINDVPYQFEEIIHDTDMHKLEYVKVFYNPLDYTEYITEIGLNKSILNTNKSVKNGMIEDKDKVAVYTPENKFEVPKKALKYQDKISNIIMAVSLIPFILVSFVYGYVTIGNVLADNIKYQNAMQSWTRTSATITNINTEEYTTDDGEYTEYNAQGKYVVNNISYPCSKKVPSDSETNFEIYYNPENVSEYMVEPEHSIDSMPPTIGFMVLWVGIITIFIITKLSNPIKLIYLIVLYGGNLIILAYNLLIKI